MKKLALKLRLMALRFLAFFQDPGKYRKEERYRKSSKILEQKVKRKALDRYDLLQRMNSFAQRKKKIRKLTDAQIKALVSHEFSQDIEKLGYSRVNMRKGKLSLA